MSDEELDAALLEAHREYYTQKIVHQQESLALAKKQATEHAILYNRINELSNERWGRTKEKE